MKELRRKQLPTASELRLLQILWESGEATVEEVVNAHSLRDRPNYKHPRRCCASWNRRVSSLTRVGDESSFSSL